MAPSFSREVGARRRAEQRIWPCRGWRLTAAATIMAAGMVACGADAEDKGRGGDASDDAEGHLATQAGGSGEPILIKTQVTGFTGKVLSGSVIGDSPFCRGGTVRHEFGSQEVGFPAINVFRCTDGQLRIGFGPGPDQANNAVQTSDWEILKGTGRFAGMSGDGRMKVRFESAGASKGQETFTGRVVVP
jgi:hypothetical protein